MVEKTDRLYRNDREVVRGSIFLKELCLLKGTGEGGILDPGAIEGNLKDWVTVDELNVELHFPKEGTVLSRVIVGVRSGDTKRPTSATWKMLWGGGVDMHP